MPYWSFYASQIASLLGYNPFEDRYSALVKYLRKVVPNHYQEAVEQAKVKKELNEEEIMEEIVRCSDIKMKESINQVLDQSSSQQRHRSIADLSALLQDALPEEHEISIEDLKNTLVSFVNRSRGTRDEEKGVQNYEVLEQKKVKDRNETFYKRRIQYADADGKTKRPKNFMIGGRVDGITEDAQPVIVEVKNRQRRLLEHVPEHEFVQVQMYMFLTNVLETHMVECFGTSTMKHVVKYDDEFVACLLDDLRILAQGLDKLISSPSDFQDMLKNKVLPSYLDLAGFDEEGTL